MDDLDRVRRRYAERIKDDLRRRHRLQLSAPLVKAFARIPREHAFIDQKIGTQAVYGVKKNGRGTMPFIV
jgi:hypothetical protein